ncbi:MAG: energy transducer TonB [Candidatus Margulisiibacteriota bacterium]
MRELTLPRVAMFLGLGMAATAALFIMRTNLSVDQAYPVFAGEEIRVERPATVKAGRVVATKTAVLQPVMQPIRSVPLPIVPLSVTQKVIPVYPQAALENGLEGQAILSVYVGDNGQPWKVEVKNSSGNSDLDLAAISALWQWRFNPASQSGAAIASWFEVPVKFALQ